MKKISQSRTDFSRFITVSKNAINSEAISAQEAQTLGDFYKTHPLTDSHPLLDTIFSLMRVSLNTSNSLSLTRVIHPGEKCDEVFPSPPNQGDRYIICLNTDPEASITRDIIFMKIGDQFNHQVLVSGGDITTIKTLLANSSKLYFTLAKKAEHRFSETSSRGAVVTKNPERRLILIIDSSLTVPELQSKVEDLLEQIKTKGLNLDNKN